MSDKPNVTAGRAESSGVVRPIWWIVFTRELRDQWVGGKALYMILIYTLLLGVYAFVMASNAAILLLPKREMVVEMVKISIAVGLFIGLVIGADAFSGERDRGTLEGLLLSPASRRQIVLGKLLAATSPWPVAMVIAIPYWVLLSDGPTMLRQALLWGPLLGSILAPSIAGLGVLVSMWFTSNRTSMLVSLCAYLVMLLPTELMGGPAKIQRTAEQWARAEYSVMGNPVAAPLRFLWKHMANGLPAADLWYWHIAPILFTVVLLVVLFWFASPRVRLEPQMAGKVRSFWKRATRAAGPAGGRPVAVAAAASPEPAGPSLPEPELQASVRARRRTDQASVHVPSALPSGPASRTWWFVFLKELRDLWIGGKAMYLCLVLAALLGAYAYIMARDSVLSLVPPPEMVYELLKAALVAAVFVGLILGADTLSGDRERATLEGLLLTPVSRRQLVVGKFLAAVSPGPVAWLIAIPYMKVLSQGDGVLGQAVFWAAIWYALLVPAFTALGMFVGFWCNSNKTSMFVSLGIYLLFLLPTQLPGRAQGGFMGYLLQWVNPMAAERVFLSKILTNNRWLFDTYGPGPLWSWGLSSVVFAGVMYALLFGFAGPRLRFEGGWAPRLRQARAHAAVVLLLASLLALGAPRAALAQTAAPSVVGLPMVEVSIDLDARTVKAGTPVLYKTVLANHGGTATPTLIVAMNIINLNAKGEIVDPEDWSPQRTQYTEPIAPGQSVSLDWRVNAILDGNYMIYMVVVPPPTSAATTSHPIASPAIHLTVTPFTRLNPGGVLPFAIGGPLVLALVIFLVYRHRHRQIDAGGAA